MPSTAPWARPRGGTDHELDHVLERERGGLRAAGMLKGRAGKMAAEHQPVGPRGYPGRQGPIVRDPKKTRTREPRKTRAGRAKEGE